MRKDFMKDIHNNGSYNRQVSILLFLVKKKPLWKQNILRETKIRMQVETLSLDTYQNSKQETQSDCEPHEHKTLQGEASLF